MLDDAVLDAHALHVLAADVEDEVDIRTQFLRTAQMCDGLDLAAVGLDGLEQQRLAVAGRRRVADGHERVALLVTWNLRLERLCCWRRSCRESRRLRPPRRT